MVPITIIAGCPCAGKTALSSALAESSERGIHLSLDSFFSFVTHIIDPTKPESDEQNKTIMRSGLRAARAFFESGYDVFVDGVFGPWWVPTLIEEYGAEVPVEYVVIRASLVDELERASKREGKELSTLRPAGRPFREVVEAMHPKFADLGKFEEHVLETEGLSIKEVFAEYSRRHDLHEFDLDVTPFLGKETS